MSTKSGIEEIKVLLSAQEPTYRRLLPPEISVDIFTTMALNAFWQNPDLLRAHRKSIVQALLQSCRAGLLPDGREGVIVVYETNVNVGGRKQRLPVAQWIPMVAGLIKLTYAAGAKNVILDVVRERDRFVLERGDFPRIVHEPKVDEDNAGPILFAYAIVVTADDVHHHAWVSRAKIDKARSFSRASSGPLWTEWYEEAAKKTAMRALWKTLPIPPSAAGSRLAAAVTAHDGDFDFTLPPSSDEPPGIEAAEELAAPSISMPSIDPVSDAVTSSVAHRRSSRAQKATSDAPGSP